MLERIEDLPGHVVGIKARGEVTAEDYRRVVEPLLRETRNDGRPLRLLYDLGEDFERFSLGGVWEDARLGLQRGTDVERCAVVSDGAVVRAACQVAGQLAPVPVRVFRSRERDRAVEWLARPPSNTGISHRLLPELGVVVVKIHGSITREDMEDLALTIDTQAEIHDALQGIVAQAESGVRWDSVGSALAQVRFLRKREGRVRRLAITVDGALPTLIGPMLERLLGAEVLFFPGAQHEAAIQWAAGGRNVSGPETDGQARPSKPRGFDPVHQAGIESFPASDPPSFTPEG